MYEVWIKCFVARHYYHVVSILCGSSVAYFDHVTVFKAPYLRTSIKGRAQTRCVNAVTIDANYGSRLSPALNGTSAIRRFEHSDTIEMCDGIIFDFYTGLPDI